MDDTQFQTLQLSALICPQEARWPRPDVELVRKSDNSFAMQNGQWPKLREVVDEARHRVATAWAAMGAIDADADLSTEGRTRQKKTLAAEAIADFRKSNTLANAKGLIERLVAKWAEETGLTIKPPSTLAEAIMQSEIRAHIAAMGRNRIDFLGKHGTDPRVASAVIGAPPFLSGLTDTELGVVRRRVEMHVAPEIVKAKEATLKALADAENGWERAIAKIGERAGLVKHSDGTWRETGSTKAG